MYCLSEDKVVTMTLYQYFNNAVNSIAITVNKSFLIDSENLDNLVEILIKKCESNPSVL